ncbi:MAG: SWIM zinc finger family protein [Culicoidibacterales bacterium]
MQEHFQQSASIEIIALDVINTSTDDNNAPQGNHLLPTTIRMFKATETFSIEDSGSKYQDEGGSIVIVPMVTSKATKTHIVRPSMKCCTCGAWQDLGYPCRHAFAYFTKFENLPLHDIIHRHVSQYYTIGSLQGLYNQSFIPIVSDNIPHDRITNPPPIGKRPSGRPRVKRLRQRHEYGDPELSRISCSICKVRGHSARTCNQP